MIKVTRDLLRAANSCYGAARENELIPENGLTIREVAELDIPVRDKIWAICYASNAPDNALREFACWCARNALNAARKVGREPDPRSWNAVDIAERYARGEASQAELDAAYYAASGNARAAYFAAYYAASHAAYYTAYESAFYAASNAAYYTASEAASHAAYGIAREEQLAELVRLLDS